MGSIFALNPLLPSYNYVTDSSNSSPPIRTYSGANIETTTNKTVNIFRSFINEMLIGLGFSFGATGILLLLLGFINPYIALGLIGCGILFAVIGAIRCLIKHCANSAVAHRETQNTFQIKHCANFAVAPQNTFLIKDIFQIKSCYLKFSELAVYAQVNKVGRSQITGVMITRARQLGYEGQDKIEAIEYLKEIFIEILNNDKILNERPSLKNHYIYSKKTKYYFLSTEKIDLENTLNNLKILSTKETLSLLLSSIDGAHHGSFEKIRKYVSINHHRWDPCTDQELSQLGIEILGWASHYGEKNIVNILLDYGIDPNKPTARGWVPLHWAVASPNPDPALVSLLIARGANVNACTQNRKATVYDIALGRLEHFSSLIRNKSYDRENLQQIQTAILHLDNILEVLSKNGAKSSAYDRLLSFQN